MIDIKIQIESWGLAGRREVTSSGENSTLFPFSIEFFEGHKNAGINSITTATNPASGTGDTVFRC